MASVQTGEAASGGIGKFLGDANIDAKREMHLMFKDSYLQKGGPPLEVKEFEKKLTWFAKRDFDFSEHQVFQ